MKKYRIVEFNNGMFALQSVIFGIIPIDEFVDLKDRGYHWGKNSDSFEDCLTDNVKMLYNYSADNYKIKRVVKQSKLEKALK